jgi:hypothetical protein
METGQPRSSIRNPRTSLGRLLLCGAAALLLAGCQKNEEIEKYQVLRPQVVRPKKPLNRMLAAIFPKGDSSWFIKLVGPESAVGKHEAAFDQFVHSIRIKDGEEPPLTWKVPKGWRRKPGGGGVRFATFLLGPEGRPLEVAVFSFGGSVLDNVNRWRKQLELPPVSRFAVGDVAQKIRIHGAVAYLVDMSGTGSGQTQMGPFAGGGGGHGRAARPPVDYQAPKGWRKQDPGRGGKVVVFAVGAGGEASIFPFPAGMADTTQLVNILRDTVNLPPVTRDRLKESLGELEVAGAPAAYVDLKGRPEKSGQRRVLAVIAVRRGFTWLITLKGPARVVGQHKAAFEEFAQSVKFGRDKGANDE